MIVDYRRADLEVTDRALCDFAVRLTVDPGGMRKGDVRSLVRLGWSEAEVNIAVQVIGYFNYINRVADALGVDLEDWMTRDRTRWRAEKPDFRTEFPPRSNADGSEPQD